MYFSIVGSRRRNGHRDRYVVFSLVDRLIRENIGRKVTIVSGACPKGADRFAAEAARAYGLELMEHPVPNEPPVTSAYDFRKRAFDRNRLVARDGRDGCYALVSDDRTGGTENTISHARDLGIKIHLNLGSSEIDEWTT